MLHRLVYASAIAGVVHYYWLVKSDVRKPVFYGTVVGLLLLYRVGLLLLQGHFATEPAARRATRLTMAEKPEGWESLRNAFQHPPADRHPPSSFGKNK